MPYDFSTLNDKELERLSKDLLNAKFNYHLQDFKSGKDQGIDLRFSTPENNNSIVVQVKHYLKSGYTQLISTLKKEVKKVKKLNPDKYIITTSIELSANQKDTIKKLFHPYIKTSNDVIGQEDLNSYLSEFPTIEKQWFKLWLTSTNVLETILRNGELGKAFFFESEIKRRLSVYVKIKHFEEALNIIQKHNYILITGQPGVGKTTLAKQLTFDLLSKGFQLIYIDDEIKEAENLFNPSPEAKQIFYFDDFLGANYFEIMNPKTTESRFVNFLDRIKSSKNKLLILTTRTTVLKNALAKYEKLNRTKIDLARKEIQLGEYSNYEKAQILYNHLYHILTDRNYIDEIIKDKNYWKIIKHDNYNPRLIEFFTDKNNLVDTPPQKYLSFILNHLDNPEEVWLYAYQHQFSAEDKLLLHSIFTSNNGDIKKIQLHFEDFLYYEMTFNNYKPDSNPFNTSCRRLLDGILHQERFIENDRCNISFINPSIRDFLINYFANNEEDRWKLIKGCNYIEQLEIIENNIYNIQKIKGEWLTEFNDYISYLLNLDIDSIKTFEKKGTKYTLLRLGALIANILTDSKMGKLVDDYINSKILCLTPTELIGISEYYFKQIITPERNSDIIYRWTKINWDEIIVELSDKAVHEDDFDFIQAIFERYEEDYNSYIDSESSSTLKDKINSYVTNLVFEWIDDGKSNIYDEMDLDRLKRSVEKDRNDILSKYELDTYYDEEYYFSDIESELEYIMSENNASAYDDWKEDNYSTEQNSTDDDSKTIDDLFS